MFVAGYTFHVLNNAFISHWGFQEPNTTPAWRVAQRKDNEKKFKSFAKEVSARYGRDPMGIVPKLAKMNTTQVIYYFARKKVFNTFKEVVSKETF
jgi:hypothetical protein